MLRQSQLLLLRPVMVSQSDQKMALLNPAEVLLCTASSEARPETPSSPTSSNIHTSFFFFSIPYLAPFPLCRSARCVTEKAGHHAADLALAQTV